MSFWKGELTVLLFHQVTLCSNTVMEFYRRMLVDLEGFGKGVAALVITARYQPLPGLPQALPCPGCAGCSCQGEVLLSALVLCQLGMRTAVLGQQPVVKSSPAHSPARCWALF